MMPIRQRRTPPCRSRFSAVVRSAAAQSRYAGRQRAVLFRLVTQLDRLVQPDFGRSHPHPLNHGALRTRSPFLQARQTRVSAPSDSMPAGSSRWLTPANASRRGGSITTPNGLTLSRHRRCGRTGMHPGGRTPHGRALHKYQEIATRRFRGRWPPHFSVRWDGTNSKGSSVVIAAGTQLQWVVPEHRACIPRCIP
jgi:hypothetical protein